MNFGGATPDAAAKEPESVDDAAAAGGTEAGLQLADELRCLRTLSMMSGSGTLLSDPAAAVASRLEAALAKLEGEQRQRGPAGGPEAEEDFARRDKVMQLLRKEAERLRSREQTHQNVSTCALCRAPAAPLPAVLTALPDAAPVLRRH